MTLSFTKETSHSIILLSYFFDFLCFTFLCNRIPFEPDNREAAFVYDDKFYAASSFVAL